MEKELAEKIVELMEDAGKETRMVFNYSGRGMYKKSTAGVVCDSIADLLATVINNADQFCTSPWDEGDDFDDFEPEPLFSADRFNIDSMGLSTIVY
jgi:hypothetical protein